MKNYFKILFMFVLVFIGFSNVSAEDNLKCVYKQDSAETKFSIENLNGNLSIDLLSDGEHMSISSDALSNISLANFQDLENNKWICDESLFVKYEAVSQAGVISKVSSSDSSEENRFKFNLIASESEYGFPITSVDSETGEIEDLTTCDYGEIKFQFNSTNFLSSFNSYDGINESIYTIRNINFDQTDLTEGTCPKVLYRLYMNPSISSSANMNLSVSYYLEEPSVSAGNVSDSITFDGKEINNIPINVENTEDSNLTKFEINEGNKITCGDTELPLGLVIFSSNIFTIIKLLVPIILIISGSITLANAVVSSDEKVGKESTQSFIRRIIGAIILFMVFQLTQIGLSIGDGFDNKLDSCVNLLINGTDEDNSNYSKYCSDYTFDSCPSIDSYGNMCTRQYTTATIKECVYKEVKHCPEYSVDDCPSIDESGNACGLSYVNVSDSGPTCNNLEEKYCSQYLPDDCPIEDTYGNRCTKGYQDYGSELTCHNSN